MTAFIGQALWERAYTGVCRDAAISDCTRYRYQLKRWWSDDENGHWACFIMLNPSTADAANDDPTIRRCMSFAQSWGCVGLYVVNLFGWRATDPRALARSANPVGKENDWYISKAVEMAKGPIVAAWGAHPFAVKRAAFVMSEIESAGATLQCLGLTKDGHPRHPLYVAGATQLVPFYGALSPAPTAAKAESPARVALDGAAGAKGAEA